MSVRACQRTPAISPRLEHSESVYEFRTCGLLLHFSHSKYEFRLPNNLPRNCEIRQFFARRPETIPLTAGGQRTDPATGTGLRAKTVRPCREGREINGCGGSTSGLCQAF